MLTFEIIWRSAVLFVLAFLAWSYFLSGGVLVSAVLLICLPVWLYITLYSLDVM